ncbi:GL10742 [Drosophila persimilis]|uniref:GL10742 n=1 Tax=Drosophila persimilis TaxID=7234 RepID=B4GAA2_DROPE|nr:GL10742 [Drosophila persimilis]
MTPNYVLRSERQGNGEQATEEGVRKVIIFDKTPMATLPASWGATTRKDDSSVSGVTQQQQQQQQQPPHQTPIEGAGIFTAS